MQTKVGGAAFSTTRPWSSWLQAMMQDAQDPESELEIEMEDIMSDDSPGSSVVTQIIN